MRTVCLSLLLLILPIVARAIDQAELNVKLAVLTTNQGDTYLSERNAIVSLGTNILPYLVRTAVNNNLPWQNRLVARICYERIMRYQEIEVLIKTNWCAHPKYNIEWEKNIIGPEARMGKMVMPDLQKVGLWYYYLEVEWKHTRETPTHPIWKKIANCWPSWCFSVVKDVPERTWYLRICSETLADPNCPVETFRELFWALERDKKGDTIPLLIQFADKHKKNAFASLSPDTRIRDQGERDGFAPILSYADTRHADLLAKFMSERPALTSLTNRLDAVRARKAVDEPEPPFRLGTNLVVITP